MSKDLPMVKKNDIKSKYQTDDFDIDSDLDLPDFNFDSDEISTDRNPVISTAKSALRGAADSILNTNVIRSTIRKTLPKDYGRALDITDHAAGSVRSLYDTAAKEFKPVANDLKRISGQIAPSVEGILGKKIADRLRKLSKTDDTVGIDLSVERQRNDALVMELGNIFQAQAETDDKKNKSEERKEQFRDGIEQIRHRDQVGQLDSIRVGIDRLTSYQDNVLSNFQKKSLELQFRHYFATADLLEVTKKYAADQDVKLQGILKNTGLPEFVKINESERFSELARNKFYSDIRDSLFGEFDGTEYIKKFIDNVKDSISEKIHEWGQTASQASFMAGMAVDSMGPGGPSKSEIIGNIAGSLAGGYAIDKGQNWLKKQLDNNPALAKGAENISYRINNSAQLIDDHMANADWGGFDGLRQFLNDNRPQVMADTSMEVDSLAELNKPIPFNRSANKSIIEIIPGYLARIHRELQVIRTGDDTIGLATYDFTSNKFTTERELSKKTISNLITGDGFSGQGNINNLKERQNEFLKFIDPEGKFSEVQKKVINDTLLRTSISRTSTDAKNLTDRLFWRKAGDEAGGISDVFSKLLETDDDGKRADTLSAIKNQNIISNSIKNLTSEFKDPRARIQEMVNAGQYDVLRDSGLIDEQGNISINNLVKLLNNDSEDLYVDSNRISNTSKNKKRGKLSRIINKTVSRTEEISRVEHSGLEPLKDAIASLQETFKTPATLKPIETIIDLIKSIDSRLNDGLMVFGDTTGRVSSRDQRDPSWISKKAQEAKKRWSEISLGEIASKAKELGSKGITYARDKISQVTGMAGTIAGKMRDVVETNLQKAADKFGDIYVGSELQPRMTRARMLAGEYVDQATGKILTSLDDIKGVIVDKQGNIVLSIEDLKTAKLRGKVVEYLKDKIQGFGGLLAKAAAHSSTVFKGLYGKMFSMGILGFQSIKKMLPPYDVYVNGSMEQPLLFASQFKLGSYFSQKTGKVLRHPRDIDGPVLDKDGNIIVTQEQIGKGLVDRNGIDVSNYIGRGLNKVKDLGLAGFSLLKKFGMSVKNLATGALGSLGEMVKGLFNGFSYFGEKYVEINKDQLDVQLEILKLLQERLPKKTSSDKDGDGVREGSVEDIIRRRQNERDNKENTLSEKAKAVGTGGTGIYGAIANLFKGKKKEEQDDDNDDDGSLLSDAADAADIYDSVKGDRNTDDRKRRRMKRLGKSTNKATTKLGKLAQGAKGLAGRAAGTIGKVGGMALGAATTFFGLGNTLGTAGKIGGALGRTALAGGSLLSKVGMGAGRLALSALASGSTLGVARMALMGLTGALFSPIGLAALGLTAAYYGYKYLTRRKLEVLNKVRYVQYGFNANDNDHFNAVFDLEDALEEHVKLDGGTASIDDNNVDLNKLAEPFGVKAENKESVRKWTYWFNERFKPIFLAHKSVLKTIKPEVKISSVDGSKLSPEEKLRYLGATELPSANYDIFTSPFKDLERLSSDGKTVNAQIEIARAQIEKEIKDNGKPKPLTATSITSLSDNSKGLDSFGKSSKEIAGNSAVLGLSSLVNGLNKQATINDASLKITAQSSISADYLFTGEKGQMDALTVIRYKTYGLLTMDSEKVKALRYLEVYVARNTVFNKDGAQYVQDVAALLEHVKAYFGISGASSPRGHKWITWFRTRFLPVFLNFATAVEKTTGKSDIVQAERALTPEQAVAAAAAIYTTATTLDGRKLPVWRVVDVAPWDNYVLNNNEDSIELNLEALKEAAKAVIRGEHKSDKIRQKTADNRNQAVKESRAPDNSVKSETGGGAVVTYRKPFGISESQRAESTVYGNSQPEFMRQDGKNVRAVGEYMTGMPIKHPGTGTGGDINSLPDPGTNSGAEAIIPLLLEVAKMTGVDPKVLINMCAIESKFDPQARPFNPRTGKYLSSAVGLMQFLKNTWAEQLRAHGAKYGIALGTPPTDARANALMGAEYIKSNMKYLKNHVKRDLTATDIYLAHFLGPEGAAKFLKIDKDTPAEMFMPEEAKANPGVFRDKSDRSRTASEIYNHFTKKMANQAKSLGVSDLMISKPVTDISDSKLTKDTPLSKVNNTISRSVSNEPSSNTTNASIVMPASKSAATDSIKSVVNTQLKASASITDDIRKLPVPGSASGSSDIIVNSQPQATVKVSSKPEGFVGFQPQVRPSSQEIQAMDKANSLGLEKGISDVNRTLLRSLGIHEESRDLLRKIVDGMSTILVSGDVKTPSQPSRPVQPHAPVEVPKAPISMGRRS